MTASGTYSPAYHQPPPEPHPWGPFTAGQLLRRTFHLYREYFGVFLGLSAVAAALSMLVQLPMQLMPLALGLGNVNPGMVSPGMVFAKMLIMIPIGLLSALVGMYIFALTYGAMFFAVSDIRQGRPVSVTSALQETAPRSLRLLGAYLLAILRAIGWVFLFGLAFAIVFGILVFICVAAGMQFPSAQSLQAHGATGAQANFAAVGVALIAFAFFVLVAIVAYLFFVLWLYGRYLLFIPAVLSENARANAAVSRSIELTRGSKGRIYALLLICFLLGMVAMVAASPFMFLAIRGATHGVPVTPVITMAEILVIALVQMVLMHPVLGIGLSLCYFDLRARKDAAPVGPPPLPAHFVGSSAIVAELPPAPSAPAELPIEPAHFQPEPEDAPQPLEPEPPFDPDPPPDPHRE